MNSSVTEQLFKISALLGLFLVWQLSVGYADVDVLPSPWNVANQLWAEFNEGALTYHLLVTMKRVAVSFAVAMLIGSVIGFLMGWFRWVNILLDVPVTLALNIPALVVIILCYIWFGLSDAVAMLAVILNKTPMVIVTIREGVKTIDRRLLEVATVFDVSPWRTFWHVLLPQLYPFVLTCVRNGLSLIWKIVLVVELIGCSSGVGFKLGVFFQYFDIANILAYTFAFVMCILIIEATIIQPLEKRSNRWRHG